MMNSHHLRMTYKAFCDLTLASLSSLSFPTSPAAVLNYQYVQISKGAMI